jgi:hypothetical protein
MAKGGEAQKMASEISGGGKWQRRGNGESKAAAKSGSKAA